MSSSLRVTDRYCASFCIRTRPAYTLQPGPRDGATGLYTTTPHKLKSSEVYYITAGKGLVHIDDKSFEVGPESTVYIRPHSVQYTENTGDDELIFLCIVDPAWRQKDEQVLDG